VNRNDLGASIPARKQEARRAVPLKMARGDQVFESLSLRRRVLSLKADVAMVGAKRRLSRNVIPSSRWPNWFGRVAVCCALGALVRAGDMLELWNAIGLDRLFIGIEAVTDEDLTSYNKRLEGPGRGRDSDRAILESRSLPDLL
jgi:hypothetical protein